MKKFFGLVVGCEDEEGRGMGPRWGRDGRWSEAFPERVQVSVEGKIPMNSRSRSSVRSRWWRYGR